MKATKVLCFLIIFLAPFLFDLKIFAAMPQIPDPIGDIYVQDFAGILSEAEKEELKNIGRSIEDQTTAQIAVLTVESIGESTIDEYSNKAFRQYGIGNKEENNGVLLVLALDDRKIRIEVGYGLEGRIPDAKAGRILNEYSLPYLKNEQPNLAITETYKVLANEVLEEYGLEGNLLISNPPVEIDDGIGIPKWVIIILVICAIILDFKYFGGNLTYLLLSIISKGGGKGSGGPRGGGGGSSGGGGASRGW